MTEEQTRQLNYSRLGSNPTPASSVLFTLSVFGTVISMAGFGYLAARGLVLIKPAMIRPPGLASAGYVPVVAMCAVYGGASIAAGVRVGMTLWDVGSVHRRRVLLGFASCAVLSAVVLGSAQVFG